MFVPSEGSASGEAGTLIYYKIIGSGGTGATFYQHTNYGGDGITLNKGNYSLSQLNAVGIANDDVSSIKVSSGSTVVVYQHDNFLGTSWAFAADDANLVNRG